MSFDPIAYARLVGAVARLQELHDHPETANPGESVEEQARIVASYARTLGSVDSMEDLVRACKSWGTKAGEPVPTIDLMCSPLMWALWLANPHVAEDVRHRARLGKITASKAKAILLETIPFVDVGRLPAIEAALRMKVRPIDRARSQG